MPAESAPKPAEPKNNENVPPAPRVFPQMDVEEAPPKVRNSPDPLVAPPQEPAKSDHQRPAEKPQTLSTEAESDPLKSSPPPPAQKVESTPQTAPVHEERKAEKPAAMPIAKKQAPPPDPVATNSCKCWLM